MSEMHDPFAPAGEPVDATPAEQPRGVTLTGTTVSLVPLDVAFHAPGLYEASHGPDAGRFWQYLSDGPFTGVSDLEAYLRRKSAAVDSVLFTILQNSSRQPAGLAGYLRITPEHRVIEVGNLMFGRSLQRTTGATEAMYLMARHAFEDLRYRRYEWKCNLMNEGSGRAALRLGFTFEGVFRQHMIVKGRSRDTAWFSMLDSEWPNRKLALEQWLAPSNFDEQGRQKRSLEQIRTALE